MISVIEYQTRRTTFSNNIFSFIHIQQISFSKKNMPYFCLLSTKKFCKMSKNPLRIFICIKFQLSHYVIAQLSSFYCVCCNLGIHLLESWLIKRNLIFEMHTTILKKNKVTDDTLLSWIWIFWYFRYQGHYICLTQINKFG